MEDAQVKGNALIQACKLISDRTGGECPYATYGYDINCETRCNAEIEDWKCWYDYFKNK